MKISGNGIEVSRISLPRLAWLLIGCVMFWHLLYITCSKENRDHIIISDGAGYYAYLPAVFIYHDYEYKFAQPGEKKVPFDAADFSLFMNRTKEGKLINKYFIGTAFMEMPFFLIAYGTAPWFGYHANGYSFPFQLAVALAAIFWVLLGLDQLRRLLSKFGISEPLQALVLLLLFLGTNLYYYTLCEPAMSHAYSFSMVAVFLNRAYNVFHKSDRRSILWMILALTMVIFLRPVNGVIVFALPFIAGSWKNFTDGVRFVFSTKKMLIGGAAGFAFMLFIQLLMYKLGVGKWFADSYSGEVLDLTNVHFLNVLFSWRKGWFIYTPIMLIAVAGIFFLRNSFERITFSVFLLVNIWVIASWQTWAYGGSLGMRPFIDTYALMAIPLALLLQALFRIRWTLLITIPLLGFLSVLNLVQHYQYRWGILPYDETSYDIYKKVFFETDIMYSFLYQPFVIAEHTLPANAVKVASYTETFEGDSLHEHVQKAVSTEQAFEGKHSLKLQQEPLSTAMYLRLKDFVPDTTQWSRLWIVMRSKVYLPVESIREQFGMSFRNAGTEYYQGYVPIFAYADKIREWDDFYYAFRFPQPPGSDVELAFFLIHSGQLTAYADNLQIEFWLAP